MATTQTQLFPPPVRGSTLSEPEQRYLATIQYHHPLRIGDTSSGPYAEALPPAGLNATTGQSNQDQELIYIKGSADANAWTITGAINGAAILTAQYSIARFKSDGTNWWLSAAGATGGGTVPSTRTIATTLPLTGGGDLSADRIFAINNFTGDSGAGGLKGAVPAPTAGDTASFKYLFASGIWKQISAVELVVPFVSKSADYTLTANDFAVQFTATATATLPAGMPTGKMFRLKIKTGTLTVTPASGLIDDIASASLGVANQAIDVMFDGTNWQIF